MQNSQSPDPSHNVPQTIGDRVETIVESCQSDFVKFGIVVEFDFEPIYASVDPEMLSSATIALLKNAITKMPNGGQITVTLIDGKHQWELEIADTSGMAFNPFESYDDSSYLSKDDAKNSLPTIIPFPDYEHLRNALRAALACGSQIQTFDCPQGGTAHVLVVPKFEKTQSPPLPHQRKDCA